jgi:hypothetical protein
MKLHHKLDVLDWQSRQQTCAEGNASADFLNVAFGVEGEDVAMHQRGHAESEEPVDLLIRTTHSCQRLSNAGFRPVPWNGIGRE